MSSLSYLIRFRNRLLGIEANIVKALTMPVGQIHLDEAKALGSFVACLSGNGPIVEIGTLFGSSTKTLALFKKKDQPLITVDSFVWNPLRLTSQRHYECTKAILQPLMDEYSVQLVRMPKSEFYRTYDGPSPELVFLDADHSYNETKEDITWAKRVNAKMICVHDYQPQFPGVVKAVDELGGPKSLVHSLAVL